jgi:hypothetical protein
MQSINVFHKGINTDLDYSKRGNDVWDFPALNLRAINKDGQGLIITNVNGNDYDPTNEIGIQLSEGFTMIGCKEYNGILYIISYNNVSRQSEIGCFPSPKCVTVTFTSMHAWSITYNSLITGFEKKYKPLTNYFTDKTDLTTRTIFRNTLMGLSSIYPVEVNVYKNYDDSVNIYLCDGHNMNYVINSSFNQTGELTTRQYDDNDIPYYISHIPLTKSLPNLSSLTLQTGGELRSGNMFLYIKYVNDNYNRTKVVQEIGPISIYKGDSGDIYSVEGIQGIDREDGSTSKSDKRISLTLSNLDTSYQYIEISYVRYYSDESDVVIRDTKIIDTLYKIEASTINVIITGREVTINIPESELLDDSIKELTSQTQTIHNGRYYGGNWTRINTHNEYLKTYASLVVGRPYKDSYGISKSTGYKDYNNVLNFVTYFRNEAYPVGIVFVFKGGIESEVYETNGYDYPSSTHVMGIVRMPTITDFSLYDNSINRLKILGIYFENNTANNYLLSNIDAQNYFNDNIIGYYYVRGDRFKNMQYQGITMYGCRGYRFWDSVKENTTEFLDHYDGIKEQVIESASLFLDLNHNYTNDLRYSIYTYYGSLQHGQSINQCNVSTNLYTYLSNIAPTTSICTIGVPTSPIQYSPWVGQSCKKYSEDQSESEYWGANRGKTENIKMFGGKKDVSPTVNISNGLSYNDDEFVIPIYKGFMPNTYWHLKASDNRKVFRNYMSRVFYVEKKYGLFSPDNILNQTSIIDSNYKMIVNGKVDYEENQNVLVGRLLYRSPIDIVSKSDVDTYPMWWKTSIYDIVDESNSTIYTIDTVNVDKFRRTNNAKNGFVSEYTDIGVDTIETSNVTQSGTCMWYFFKEETDERWECSSNRSMSTSKYIGITLDSHVSNLNLRHVSLYKIDPSTLNATTLPTYFDLKHTWYSKISDLILWNTTTHEGFEVTNIGNPYYKGDCFLQSTYIKVMSYRGTSFIPTQVENIYEITGADQDRREDNDEQRLIYNGHGLVMEMITENEINTEMRISQKDRTFYPACGEDGLKSFAVFNPDTSDKTESLAINYGYNVVRSSIRHYHYDRDNDYRQINYETRIRYSDKIIENSYTDAFRNLKIMSYKDYDITPGPIMKLETDNKYLYSFQHRRTNIHFTDQRQMNVPTNEGEVVVGRGDILEQSTHTVLENGIQHRRATVKGFNGIYALDWNKRAIFRVSAKRAPQDLTLSESFSTKVYSLLEGIEKLTDIESQLSDMIYLNQGVSLGYDKKYSDILFTILYGTKSTTYAFNEILEEFTCEYSFTSPIYANINNDFYSLCYSTNNYSGERRIYLHDRPYLFNGTTSNKQTFYGTTRNFDISVICNGNSPLLSKRFDSLEIESGDLGFTQIIYNTSSQTGLHDAFDVNDVRFWLRPEYVEGKWKFPIQVQTTPTNSFFTNNIEMMINSNMRGEWLKINLNYSGIEDLYLKNIITNFENSFT